MDSEASHLSDTQNNQSVKRRQCSYSDYPERNRTTKSEYQEAEKKFFEAKGFKYTSDFSDDEKKAIVDDCTINLMGSIAVSEKYNTMVHIVTRLVRLKGLSISEDDLSKCPDFPKKSGQLSYEEY